MIQNMIKEYFAFFMIELQSTITFVGSFLDGWLTTGLLYNISVRNIKEIQHSAPYSWFPWGICTKATPPDLHQAHTQQDQQVGGEGSHHVQSLAVLAQD